MKKSLYIIIGVFSLLLSGCKDEVVSLWLGDDSEIRAGEPVQFTTYMPTLCLCFGSRVLSL